MATQKIPEWLNLTDIARHFGYNPKAAYVIASRGGIFTPCLTPLGKRYHIEQIRLADCVMLGVMTQEEALKEWEQFKALKKIRPVKSLPRKRNVK